jgi:hypothetical protein
VYSGGFVYSSDYRLCAPRLCPEGTTVFSVEAERIRCAADDTLFPESLSFRSIDIPEDLATARYFNIEGIEVLDRQTALVITRQHGLYRVTVPDETWQRIDSGLPPEVIWPFDSNRLKPVISYDISADKQRIAVIIPSELYMSHDGGKTFSKRPLAGVLRFSELLSVALHPRHPERILVGASAIGMYYSTDDGNTVVRIKEGLPGEPTRSPNFLEEVRSIVFADDENFYAGLAAGGGIYKGNLITRTLTRSCPDDMVTYPDGQLYLINRLSLYDNALFCATSKGPCRVLSTNDKPVAGNIRTWFDKTVATRNTPVFSSIAGSRIHFPSFYIPPREFTPDPRAQGIRALYISYAFTQGDNYDKLIRHLKDMNMNAVVINFKDDYGRIRIPVNNPKITAIPGSLRPYVKTAETISRLKKDGIYVIARQVCFKDSPVYHFENYKYAVKNINTGAPLFKGPEKWVDAFSEFVWDYNIEVAKELEKAGVDEIQFDYIRLPDTRQNDVRKCDFQKENQTMREALSSFLIKARGQIQIPISFDLFGYNGVYKWGNFIGQDITELTRYVDVVSSMYYPSHYTGGFGWHYGDKRIYYTILISCKRALEMTNGVIHRPYLQAFYYKDNEDKYGVDYIVQELQAIKDAGLSDYIFWNDLSERTIMVRGINKYHGKGDQLTPEMRANIPQKIPFDQILEPGYSD